MVPKPRTRATSRCPETRGSGGAVSLPPPLLSQARNKQRKRSPHTIREGWLQPEWTDRLGQGQGDAPGGAIPSRSQQPPSRILTDASRPQRLRPFLGKLWGPGGSFPGEAQLQHCPDPAGSPGTPSHWQQPAWMLLSRATWPPPAPSPAHSGPHLSLQNTAATTQRTQLGLPGPRQAQKRGRVAPGMTGSPSPELRDSNRQQALGVPRDRPSGEYNTSLSNDTMGPSSLLTSSTRREPLNLPEPRGLLWKAQGSPGG